MCMKGSTFLCNCLGQLAPSLLQDLLAGANVNQDCSILAHRVTRSVASSNLYVQNSKTDPESRHATTTSQDFRP